MSEKSAKSTRVSGWKCRTYVQNKQPFHNSGSNHRHPNGSTLWGEQRGDMYTVYSYGYHWPLYAYWKGIWFSNKDKYGRTTSKHSSQANPLTASVPLGQSDMALIAAGHVRPEYLVLAAKLKLLPDDLTVDATIARIAA